MAAGNAMDSVLELTIRNELEQVSFVAERLGPLLETWNVAPRTAYRTQVVIEEVLSNVVRHGYPDGGQHEISVSVARRDEGIEIRVRDDGVEFDPGAAAPVDLDQPLGERRVGGLGIHLVRQFVDSLEYRRADGRNDLRMRL